MASKPLLTSREIKNKVTGIDLMVPDYEDVAGKVSKSALYHVIVITRLFYYKSPKHKESDVVQFMIPKRYEEFEDVYQKLAGRFPSVLFPGLPRKPLIVSTSAVHERRKVMDEVMHLVARTQKLCCSPMVLEFLGVRKPQRVSNQAIVVNDDIFEERKVEQTVAEPATDSSQSNGRASAGNALQAKEEEQGDLFVPVDLDSSAASELDQEDAFAPSQTRKLELHASLFEDEVGKPEAKEDSLLFTPADLRSELLAAADNDAKEEDNDDLLNVEDDLDDLMALSKKSERKASIKTSSSKRPATKPKPQTRTSFESIPDDDDLTMLSSASTTERAAKPDKAEADLFKEARKMSLRDKRERLDKTHTLDDIFDKNSPSRNPFTKNNNDDDLFASNTAAAAAAMPESTAALEEDDIMKYITDNANQDSADLDL